MYKIADYTCCVFVFFSQELWYQILEHFFSFFLWDLTIIWIFFQNNTRKRLLYIVVFRAIMSVIYCNKTIIIIIWKKCADDSLNLQSCNIVLIPFFKRKEKRVYKFRRRQIEKNPQLLRKKTYLNLPPIIYLWFDSFLPLIFQWHCKIAANLEMQEFEYSFYTQTIDVRGRELYKCQISFDSS